MNTDNKDKSKVRSGGSTAEDITDINDAGGVSGKTSMEGKALGREGTDTRTTGGGLGTTVGTTAETVSGSGGSTAEDITDINDAGGVSGKTSMEGKALGREGRYQQTAGTSGEQQQGGQETINTMQSVLNSYVELQKNLLNSFQSVFSRFINDTSKSYLNNFTASQQNTDAYNKTNQTITDNTLNYTQRVNDFAVTSTESFNKSIEIAQKYYNEAVQNYLNFVNKIGRSYSNQ
jgi:hypothetical protein